MKQISPGTLSFSPRLRAKMNKRMNQVRLPLREKLRMIKLKATESSILMQPSAEELQLCLSQWLKNLCKQFHEF